jgi:hypothetical protein
MRRGFEHPTPASASRSSDAGPSETAQQPSIRTRRVQYEVPTVQQGNEGQRQPRTISARRKSVQQPNLPLPPLQNQPQTPPERKPPAYLHEKNPYVDIGTSYMRQTDPVCDLDMDRFWTTSSILIELQELRKKMDHQLRLAPLSKADHEPQAPFNSRPGLPLLSMTGQVQCKPLCSHNCHHDSR